MDRKGSVKESPSVGCVAHVEGFMENNSESRDQTMKKIEFYLPKLTDTQLRIVSGIIRGFEKN